MASNEILQNEVQCIILFIRSYERSDSNDSSVHICTLFSCLLKRALEGNLYGCPASGIGLWGGGAGGRVL
jgi:hypothetical protein